MNCAINNQYWYDLLVLCNIIIRWLDLWLFIATGAKTEDSSLHNLNKEPSQNSQKLYMSKILSKKLSKY